MTGPWLVVLLVGVGTAAIKSLGPLLLGGRPLPPPVAASVAFLAPALLAALVAINTLADGSRVTVDARALGVGMAALAIWRRAPVLLVIVLAAASTALARALGA